MRLNDNNTFIGINPPYQGFIIDLSINLDYQTSMII